MARKRISDTIDWAKVEARLETHLDSATPPQFYDGLAWYSIANNIANRLADDTFPPVGAKYTAGVIAALSPQANWESNVQQATDLCNGRDVANTDSRLGKAHECLGGSDPATVLHGPKESAFYGSISDPIGHRVACIDRHMVRAALAVDTDREIRLWVGRAGVYDGIADCLANIADRRQIPVPAAQAIIWNVIRDGRNSS
jgi:hypothetical protein